MLSMLSCIVVECVLSKVSVLLDGRAPLALPVRVALLEIEVDYQFLFDLICIGYNTVWSVLCECNEHNTLQTVL